MSSHYILCQADTVLVNTPDMQPLTTSFNVYIRRLAFLHTLNLWDSTDEIVNGQAELQTFNSLVAKRSVGTLPYETLVLRQMLFCPRLGSWSKKLKKERRSNIWRSITALNFSRSPSIRQVWMSMKFLECTKLSKKPLTDKNRSECLGVLC